MHDERLTNRFWAKVDRLGDCWIWRGSKFHFGHGRIKINRKWKQAHRTSWEIHNGPIPEGLCVLHHCDNPPCVRPDHLFLGTIRDNHEDMVAKDRQHRPRGPSNGMAKFTEDQVLEIRRLCAEGHTQDQLAERFGTRQSQVSRIIRFARWAYLGGDRRISSGGTESTPP